MRIPRLLAAGLLLFGLSACSMAPTDETADWSAADFYAAAKEALDNGDYETAINFFSKLEARYPYGRYAQQAQLETAYVHYKADEPDAAIAAADRFIKLHPRHPHVDYAYYLRGLASFEPGRNFLEGIFPQDKVQRDPTTARQSFNYFKELVTRFPESKYAPDAVERMTYLRNNLARYEVQVADYYMRRGAHLAAANRCKYVVENYPRTPAVADALALMARAYRAMGKDELAEDVLRTLRLNHPDYLISDEQAVERHDGE